MAAAKSNVVPLVAALTGVFLVGVLVGWALSSLSTQSGSKGSESGKPDLSVEADGSLTNPLLAYENATVSGRSFESFEKNILELVNQKISQGIITQTSIYFRDLVNGAWFGVGERETFSPASLLKVPNMISIFKLAETDPTVLQKELTYDQVFEVEESHYPPDKSLELGKTYTVEDLIYRMIVYSDNEAMFLLRANFDNGIFDQLYQELGMETPNDENPEDFMTVRSYATFFRILFNASYLNKTLSEKALEILSTISFKRGLNTGVPAQTVVAHKFGERQFTDTGVTQLHDCGVVYYPNHPYLLCVMSRGKDYVTLEKVIAEVSKTVWNEVASRVVEGTPTPQ